MQVDLKVGKVRKRQVAKTAVLDAVIWYWLHQMSYESLFTQQTNGLPVPSLISALVTAITGVVVLLAKWDRIPVAFRMVAPPLPSPPSPPCSSSFRAWPCRRWERSRG